MSIGEQLKKRRETLGISQEELAQKANTSVEEIEKFESGGYDKDMQDLKSLSEILNVSADEIIGLTHKILVS